MTISTHTLKYGKGTLSFNYDDSDILQILQTKYYPGLADPQSALLKVLDEPIGCRPFKDIIKPGDKVAFICNDTTRLANTHELMPVLVRELNRLAVPDANIQVVFALGTHRTMTEEEVAQTLTEDIAGRLKSHMSVSTQTKDFRYFGMTSRNTPVWIHQALCDVDHVIMTGSVVHHYFSGYGGGRKAILPGCAAMETIRMNHSHMLDVNARLGVTEGNPCYEDQMEGVALFAKNRSLFLINTVLNSDHETVKIFAGHYREAHLAACRFVDYVYGVKLEEPADLVIASCGGYPKDINVYQMQKTMDNAVCAVREGGVVILLAECSEGSGSKKLEETFRRLKTPEAIRKDLEENFQIGANKAYAITRPLSRADFILVSNLNKELAKTMHFTAVDTVEEAIALAKTKLGDHPKTVLMPEGSVTVPRL